jgi:hypothetical protein
MNRRPLSAHQLIPGQIYRVVPYHKMGLKLHDGMAVYKTYYLNFNCRSQAGGYSPNMKYFDVYKNNKHVDPNTVKVGDVITMVNKIVPTFIIVDVTVKDIRHIYEFSNYAPPLQLQDEIMLYSSEVYVYESAQRYMELNALAQLDTIELSPVSGGHNPRTLVNDVIHYMKPFISSARS